MEGRKNTNHGTAICRVILKHTKQEFENEWPKTG